MNKSLCFICTLFLVLSLVTGCTKHDPNELDPKTLFANHCAGCHGSDGKGRFFRGVPANVHTEKSFAEIVFQIKNGTSEKHKGKEMPGISELTDRQVKLIASYLLKMSRE